jgi:hypothetical protein
MWKQLVKLQYGTNAKMHVQGSTKEKKLRWNLFHFEYFVKLGLALDQIFLCVVSFKN